MKREKVKVEPREIQGKQVKKLRREGTIPANIYGKDFKSTPVQLPAKEFEEIYKRVRETGLIDLQLNGKSIPVLIHDVQRDGRTLQPIHADFYRVNLKEKIHANIPVATVGEAPAERDGVGVILHLLSELEVEALPADLPEKIEVSIENLNQVDDQIKVSEIQAPEGVTLLNDPEQTIVRVGELAPEEPEEAPVEETPTEAAPASEETSSESSEE